MIRQRHYKPVAQAYARSLLGAGRSLGTLAALQAEAAALVEVIGQNPGMLSYFDNPGVSTQAKLGLVDRTFGQRLSKPLLIMLRLMIERERTRYLSEALDLFGELAEREQGVHPGVVQSARPLAEADRARLTRTLEAYTGHKLNLTYEVEEDLIGGLVFRSGDLLVDGSLRHGLDEIREKLLSTPVLSKQ